MKQNGFGGKNTQVGATYEKEIDFLTQIKSIPGYSVVENNELAGNQILYNGKLVARTFAKHAFYRYLEENNIDHTTIISKKLLPDDAILVIIRKTLFIVEIKFQNGAGSVDEKLLTCDFKKKQYTKLVSSLDIYVEFIYVLNDWFKHPSYRDTLAYIESMGCRYRFNALPMEWLGLPPYDKA